MTRPYISPQYQEDFRKHKWVKVANDLPVVKDVVVVDYELWQKFMSIKENQEFVNQYESK